MEDNKTLQRNNSVSKKDTRTTESVHWFFRFHLSTGPDWELRRTWIDADADSTAFQTSHHTTHHWGLPLHTWSLRCQTCDLYTPELVLDLQMPQHCEVSHWSMHHLQETNARLMTQIIAHLPAVPAVCRTSDELPFSKTKFDFFGPMQVRVWRSTPQRWGVIFTYLNLRAVHFKVTHSWHWLFSWNF